jgi:co-chaperonin GroES (HSP10)|tara:strand:- start:459 stop:740 length:282 start_codon:yes stop_codon:yes gene_type:complete
MFKPVNRYIQVKISDPEPVKTETGILLPIDYEPKEEKYVQASTLAWSPDVRFADELDTNSKIIIDRSMVEEVNNNGLTMHLILDNYVLGLIKE